MTAPLPPATPPSTPGPVLLFDGVCNLCNASVTWIIKRDKKARIRFATLQSDFARAALAKSPKEVPDSIVLIEGERIRTRSAAALRLARLLGFPWSLLFILWIVPRPIRDAMYAWVARNRYRWFGKKDACMVPTPALRARFVADAPPKAVQACEAAPTPA